MPRIVCPTCRYESLDPETLKAPCPACGFLASEDRPWDILLGGGGDVRKLARRQRWLLWNTSACVASYVAMIAMMGLSGSNVGYLMVVGAVWIGSLGAVWMNTIWMAAALPRSGGLIAFFILTSWMPAINILVLLYINRRVIQALRHAGLRVGFMGVKDDDVIRRLSPYLCLTCGYDLTGNISGICPECGNLVRESGSSVQA